MDKKKAFEHSKRAVTLFFRVRRGFKVYVAFATGILSAIAVFGDVYDLTENTLLSMAMSVLLGAFITAVMLLIMEIIRAVIIKAKKVGARLWEKYKERESGDEKEGEDVCTDRPEDKHPC